MTACFAIINPGCHFVIKSSKESWPRGSGFDIIPEGWCLPLDNQWNNGMVEKWNIGYEKRMMSGF
jgi:hypothetical protein